MLVSVTYGPAEFESRDVSGAAVVVIDCFRASTSIATALSAGASAIYPFLSIEDAFGMRSRTAGALLAGERHGVKVDGFDLGNSPREFTVAAVAGRPVVMTTTNGTRLLSAASHAGRILVGAFVNLSATSEALSDSTSDVVLATAGTEGRFSIEDAICAGLIAARLRETSAAELDDSAVFAAELAGSSWQRLCELALSGRGAANVRAAGLADDLQTCLVIDSIPVVAAVHNDPLRIEKG